MCWHRHPFVRKLAGWTLVVLMPLVGGCQPTQPFFLHEQGDLSHYLDTSTEISYPDIDEPIVPDAEQTLEPFSVANPEIKEFWDVTLEEVVATALQNNKTINTLGQVRAAWQVGQSSSSPPETLLLSPDFSASIYDPAIQETSNTGVEAALAEFDTQFSTSLFWERTDRPQNVEPSQVGQSIFARILENETSNFQAELSKRAATGTQFFVRNITNYEGTNRPLRAVPSDWTTLMEVEARHPLLRNSGVQFNRIPVIIARVQTDRAIAALEKAVRNQVLEIERNYWDLYFLYFNLRTAQVGAQSALESWREVKTLAQGGVERGESYAVGLAEEQYYAFLGQAQEAQRRLFQSERNLRSLMSLAPTDGRFLRPIDKPVLARVDFDWYTVLEESMARSVELREQGFLIKLRELDALQARNQVLPQLDLLALYRWVGLGDQLLQSDRRGLNFPVPGSTAFDNLTEGDFQEWRLGVQLQVPLGVRAELARVRNTQLALARERDRFDHLKLEVSHGLSAAFQNVKSQHEQMVDAFNRVRAAHETVNSFMALREAGTTPNQGELTLDRLLDAQRRLAEAEVRYHETVVAYNIALAELHWRKGSLLEINNIWMQEGPWPHKAYQDALLRARQAGASRPLNYGFNRPGVVTRGPVLQHGLPADDPRAATIDGQGDTSRLPLDESLLGDPDSTPSGAESATEAESDLEDLPLPGDATPSVPTPAAPNSRAGAPRALSILSTASRPSAAPAPATAPGAPRGETAAPADDGFDWGSLGLDESE